MVAHIARSTENAPYEVALGEEVLRLCAGCIYKLVRLAGLLLRLEAAPEPKAKKPRKGAKRGLAATRTDDSTRPPLGPFDKDEATV